MCMCASQAMILSYGSAANAIPCCKSYHYHVKFDLSQQRHHATDQPSNLEFIISWSFNYLGHFKKFIYDMMMIWYDDDVIFLYFFLQTAVKNSRNMHIFLKRWVWCKAVTSHEVVIGPNTEGQWSHASKP
jgi:hypothetical protein